MRIEQATPQDSAVLAAIHAASFARPWGPGEMAALLASPGMSALIAYEDGDGGGDSARPCGFVLARAAADEAEILTLAVEPAMRRRGIGAALMRAIMHGLAARAVTGLFLEVDAGNAAALRTYETLGFGEVARRPDYYRGAERSGTGEALVLRAALDGPTGRDDGSIDGKNPV